MLSGTVKCASCRICHVICHAATVFFISFISVSKNFFIKIFAEYKNMLCFCTWKIKLKGIFQYRKRYVVSLKKIDCIIRRTQILNSRPFTLWNFSYKYLPLCRNRTIVLYLTQKCVIWNQTRKLWRHTNKQPEFEYPSFAKHTRPSRRHPFCAL